jgi:predicted  nucleic acid-binding Zn-ribbon protein
MANNWLDTQHRAYMGYSCVTKDDSACQKLLRDILLSEHSTEHTATTFYDCQISMDWVEQIEQALPYIENAIAQHRQFILKQGETVPIEKAKRVSKASVEHLSRHTELITHLPEPGDDVIPDKLYVTENVGTFAVYENRFLYMLLCHLRDFIGFRYKKILDVIASFRTEIDFSKQVKNEHRCLHFQLHFQETSTGLPGATLPETEQLVQRIYNMLQQVEMLLKTDLMKEVSMAPLLQPPISRTNVMLHDPNFKVAFALYSFLAEYAHDGFKQVERYSFSGQMPQPMRRDLGELAQIASYLSYRNGGLLPELEKRYLEEEVAKSAREERLKKERLQNLRQSLPQLNDVTAAFILELEDWNRELEKKTAMLYEVEQLRKEAEEKLTQIHATIAPLSSRIAQLQAQSQALMEENNQSAVALDEALGSLEQTKQALQDHVRQSQEKLLAQEESYKQQYEALAQQCHLAQALNLASNAANGIREDHTSKEAFSLLEAQYKALEQYYQQQWKLAKKQILKDNLRKK